MADALLCPISTRGPPQSLCPLGVWGVAAEREFLLPALNRNPPTPAPAPALTPPPLPRSSAMHIRDLVELSARIAVSASSDDPLPARDPKGRSIQPYWSAPRCRTDRWIRAIRR